MAHRHDPRSENANLRLSETLTAQLIEGLRGLPRSPKSDYLNKVLLDKYVSKETSPSKVRRERAISKWFATERNNEATEDRLLNTRPDFQILPGVTYEKFVEKARAVIESIIGASPTEDLLGGFTGGATTSRKRTAGHPTGKYLGKANITGRCRDFVLSLVEEQEAWHRHLLDGSLIVEEVPGNVLFTVLKTTDIDRVAAKEPDLNMYFQRGLGNQIRTSLRRAGIDLNDQSRNRDLAREGSITGDLATVDLSSASDSVTTELVFQLLPVVWFTWLDACRCHVTTVKGEVHRNFMFSSMGNGFTFELESLLFYALARTTAYFEGVKGVISVYGDDIIIPSALFDNLTWVLNWFGFEVNTKKSFHTGSFRESCGGHFVNGLDVTPFYIRKPIERYTDLIKVLNALRFWSVDVSGWCDGDVHELWYNLAKHIPKQFWGGHEYSSITQLVSPHLPRSRLAAGKVEKSTKDGGYLYWLDSKRLMPNMLPLVSSVKVISSEKYFIREAKIPTVATVKHYFVEEVLMPR